MREPVKERGGAFIDANAESEACWTPEDEGETAVQIRVMGLESMEREIDRGRAAAVENGDHDALRELMKSFGEQGNLGVEIPERYGGLGLGLIEGAALFEGIAAGGYASIAVTFGAHTGIGTVPILRFGSEAQKAKYLPKIASGEWIAAYALTESGSGSDALAARTTAVLEPDGRHYRLNGEKVFITNAGIADVFTVFVKIGGQNACLIVERGTPGFSLGPEERKLGIKGSSTRGLIFEDALVPAENLLGEIGKGHKIVMNTLNLGRFKLGAGALGGLKRSLLDAVAYAGERVQFGKTILTFDAVRQKIARMNIDRWVGGAMVARTAGMLEAALKPASSGDASKAIEEYTAECAIVKVALSEMLWQAADATLQIFGGYGYMEDYPAARMLRDSRINLIFEGTNEICRMQIIDALVKKAMRGEISLFAEGRDCGFNNPVMAVHTDMRGALANAKKATRWVFDRAVQKYGPGLRDEQQILLDIADMLIGVYAMESAILRLETMYDRGANPESEADVVRAFFDETMPKLHLAARRVIEACLDKDVGKLGHLPAMFKKIDELLVDWKNPFNDSTVALYRRIAAAAIASTAK